jgi:hypothetical protein
MIWCCWRNGTLRDPRPQKLEAEIVTDDPALVVTEDAKLDDVMLAMDVVDTLRHERMLITRDINSEVRRESLVDRLREIYRGQGISVPDDILMDGVKALEEERFRYRAPKDGFGTKLALLYINRGKWLPLLTTILAIIGLAGAVNYFGFERPQQVEQSRIERVMESLPGDLSEAYQAGLSVATEGLAVDRLEATYNSGRDAISAGDTVAAQAAITDLESLTAQISQSYNLDIIQPSGGDLSGIYYDAANGERLYFVIVEATNPAGSAVELSITDQISGRTDMASTFGVEVPRNVYDDLAEDIATDNDVDAARVGEKVRGELDANYVIDVRSGRLLEWQ